MNLLLVVLQQNGQAGGGWSFYIMLALIFVVFYFFMIRPQNKKQKEIQKFRNSLQIGDKVVTASGVHGVVRGLNEADATASVEVASGVKITIEKNCLFKSAADNQQR